MTGDHGGSRRSLKPGRPTIAHRSLRSSSPSTSNTSSGSTSSARVICSRIAALMPAADLHPHGLAEAPRAQLLLDRLQQVVGLVGDREVRVAGDAEDGVVEDLHAREEHVEVLGDQLLERHERAPVAERHEPRQHLLRHLHAREGLHLGDRVAHDHAERERQVGDVRERPPEAHRQRREDGEDLAPEALVEALAVLRLDLVVADDPDAVLGQRGPQLVVQAAATGARCARARPCAARRASRSACARPAAASRCRRRSGRADPRRAP